MKQLAQVVLVVIGLALLGIAAGLYLSIGELAR